MPQTYVVHLGNSKELMEVAEDGVAKRVLREHVRESLGVRSDDLVFAVINSKHSNLMISLICFATVPASTTLIENLVSLFPFLNQPPCICHFYFLFCFFHLSLVLVCLGYLNLPIAVRAFPSHPSSS